MFDESLPGPVDLGAVSDAALAAAVSGWAAASAAADARRLAAIAEIERRACRGNARERDAVDGIDAAAAQISCALSIGHGRAIRQIDRAVTLRDRLPRVGARFLAGEIHPEMIATIVWRTYLVVDGAALARIDTAIADHAHRWGRLSQYKLEKAIDFWVDRYDPDAVRRVRSGLRGRDFTIGYRDDDTGTVSVHGRLSVTDAVALGQRITAMIAAVCPDDPRTLAQRRADAMGAMGAGSYFLACRCDNPDCDAKVDDGRASTFVIHVIADRDTLDCPLDSDIHGKDSEGAGEPEVVETRPDPARRKPPRHKAALIAGAEGAIVPASLLAELRAFGATIRILAPPAARVEDRYRPSAALQEFVRSRDMTCRFPGCDRPAAYADIDHTQPWPAGATHPANIKCYCRKHHLVKTFLQGWTDRQCPDGTVVVTTPAGLAYTTKPFSRLLFPGWNTATSPPPPSASPQQPTRPGRYLMMPTRRRTRAQNRAARVASERKVNAEERTRDAERASAAPRNPVDRADSTLDELHPTGHQPTHDDEPPPF